MQTSERITRQSASNLALAFVVLPRHKRTAMSALYAFCREIDDIADEETRPVREREELLEKWRTDVRKACSGGVPEFVVNRELRPVIEEFHIPFSLFDELLRGVEMDLHLKRYPDHQLLDQYCYRVASVVGLMSIQVFGYSDPKCRDYAIALGKALQLTNILRDVGNDAARDRIYLPADALERFHVSPEDILQRRYSDRFRALAMDMASRARTAFTTARNLLPPGDRHSMIAAELMASVYWRLLRKLERENFPVLADAPVRLNKAHKLLLVALAWCRVELGLPFARYGI